MTADGSSIWRKADEDDGGGLPHVRSVPAAGMVGERHGMWLVLALSTPSAVGRVRYLCRCDCGTERTVARDALRDRRHPSRSCRPCARKAIGLAARGRKLRNGIGQGRAATISMRRFSVREHALSLLEYPIAEHATYERPVTRGDCLAGGSNAARPCPWVSCAYHLALDVSDSGNIKLTFPGTEVEDMQFTCSLDLADTDGATLDEIGAAQNISRERVRQIELTAIAHLRAERDMRRLA